MLHGRVAFGVCSMAYTPVACGGCMGFLHEFCVDVPWGVAQVVPYGCVVRVVQVGVLDGWLAIGLGDWVRGWLGEGLVGWWIVWVAGGWSEYLVGCRIGWMVG